MIQGPRFCCGSVLMTAWILASGSLAHGADPPAGISAAEFQQIEKRLAVAQQQLARLRTRISADGKSTGDVVADATIFHKGILWALRYEADLQPADRTLIDKALSRLESRIADLEQGRNPWSVRHGKLARGYVSAVDGSVQPYGVIVPAGYDGSKPIRLDVVLHGSTRPVGLSELRFIDRFDAGDTGDEQAADQPFIELHPLGRVENCYRWAGETDVFESIADVCSKYNIDRDRIVLRGMSMGASGTWHLGLKHPDKFVALGPYCGYVDTHRFSETPLATFVKVGPLPAHQELGLHMLDSIDYAANAGVVPAIACMGENDVFFQAHVIMGEAMEREGLKMVNLISPGTGHVIDPVTHAEQMRRIGAYASAGLNHIPRELRFVTWTLKYSQCHWLTVLGLEEHYRRAEIRAQILEDGTIDVDQPANITGFAIRRDVLDRPAARVRIAGKDLTVPELSATDNGPEQSRTSVEFVRRDQGWRVAEMPNSQPSRAKKPGLQGPIDDAFTTKFLCVRGTGQPWNKSVQAYSDASLRRFAAEWHHYFRGDLPIKDDTAVTAADVESCNLILFGDPGNNSWIKQCLPGLPCEWTAQSLRFAGQTYSSAEHLPALIYPNPLTRTSQRYVVINSGHTFREAELAKLNYLLFPRWGDWAILKVGDRQPEKSTEPLDETVLSAGYFDEAWRVK